MFYRAVALTLGALSLLLIIGYPLGWIGCPVSQVPTLSLFGGPQWMQPTTCTLQAVGLPPWLLGALGVLLTAWYLRRTWVEGYRGRSST